MAYKNFKMTEIIEEIGSELRKIRKSKGMTINHVANELTRSGLQISTTLLGRVENGERRVDDDSFNAICNFYEVDPASVVILASREHIKRLSENRTDITSEEAAEYELVLSLYKTLNSECQKEIINLMHLMPYMDFFNKPE